MLQAFYAKISGPVNAMGSDYFTDLTAKLKSDATYFSIADGWHHICQYYIDCNLIGLFCIFSFRCFTAYVCRFSFCW